MPVVRSLFVRLEDITLNHFCDLHSKLVARKSLTWDLLFKKCRDMHIIACHVFKYPVLVLTYPNVHACGSMFHILMLSDDAFTSPISSGS